MTHSTPSISSSSTQKSPDFVHFPVSSFLETSGKTAKVIAGILSGLAATGCFGIGVTMMPFAPEIGASAIALAITLFGTASYLIYSATSSAPDLGSRNIFSVVS